MTTVSHVVYHTKKSERESSTLVQDVILEKHFSLLSMEVKKKMKEYK